MANWALESGAKCTDMITRPRDERRGEWLRGAVAERRAIETAPEGPLATEPACADYPDTSHTRRIGEGVRETCVGGFRGRSEAQALEARF